MIMTTEKDKDITLKLCNENVVHNEYQKKFTQYRII